MAAREQIGEAMLELIATRGYEATSIDAVLVEARVERAEFDRLFDGKEDCFLQFYDEMTGGFNDRVFGAFEAEPTWRDGLRAAAYAAARWIRDHPREVRYGTIEMLAAGEVAQAHREATLRRFIAMVDRGRQELDDPDSVSPSVAEGVLGSIGELLMKNLQRRSRVRGEDLVPELMYIAVRPYLGHAVAREELTIPAPPEAVDEAERERIMDALMDSVVEVGYEATTLDDVARRAGLDPVAARRHFADKADCYAQTYRRNFAVFDRLVFGAYEAEDGWRDGLRASAYAAARYLRDYDREVRFGVIPALGAGELVAAYRDTAFQRIVDLIDAGRQELDDPDAMSRGVAEATLGAIYTQLVKRLGQSGGAGDAEDFVPELMYIAVRPYLGHAVAREELAIPAPPEAAPR